MNNQKKYNRIHYLEEKYSPTKVAQGEILSKETRQKMRKELHNNKKHLQVDTILTQVRKADMIKEEVHEIIDYLNFAEACGRCNSEQVICVVVLYCLGQHIYNFQEERTALWSRYDLSWKLYGRVVAYLLSRSRSGRLLNFNQC